MKAKYDKVFAVELWGRRSKTNRAMLSYLAVLNNGVPAIFATREKAWEFAHSFTEVPQTQKRVVKVQLCEF